jgi:inner membrane protein
LRYDLIDGQWVATDLRLGMSGYHPFRFALATVDPETGEVRLIPQVEQWPQRRPDVAALRLMAERALDARAPLSIAELSRSLAEPAAHQQR